MSLKSLSRIGIVVATFAAASAIASPSAWAAPTVTVTPVAGTFTVGDVISASGKVGSGVDVPATFVMKVFKNGNCSGNPLGVGAVKNINSTSGGGPYSFAIGDKDNPDPVKGADAGTYSWSGTLHQESGPDIVVCSTPTVVSEHSPSLTVQATNAALGGAVMATAALSNRVKTPAGGPATSMVFGLYPPADGTCTGAPVYTKSMQVYTDDNTYDSGNFTPGAAGKYRWKITYTGDGNNAAVTAGCGVTTSTVTSGGTPPPPAAVPTCEGAPATIVGSSKGETIIGTSGNDVIVARGGNDVVNGKGGNDLICGGSGKDILRGGGGNDVLHGGDGSDDVQGNQGHDELYGERGGDRIVGGGGNDKLYGGPGNDGLDGGKGSDFGNGGPGTDVGRSIEKTGS